MKPFSFGTPTVTTEFDPIRKVSLAAYLEEEHGVYVNTGKVRQKIKCINPDHDDRDPSASVLLGQPDTDIEHDYYQCFACGLKGDVLDLVQEIENVDLMTARLRTSHLPSEEAGHQAPSGPRRPSKGGKGTKTAGPRWAILG